MKHGKLEFIRRHKGSKFIAAHLKNELGSSIQPMQIYPS